MGLCSLLSPSPPVHELVPLTGVLEEDCQMVHKSFTGSHDCDLMLKQFHFQWVLILRIKLRRKSPFGTSAVWKIFLQTLLGLWGCAGLGKGACQQGGTQETNHSTTKQTKTQKKKQSLLCDVRVAEHSWIMGAGDGNECSPRGLRSLQWNQVHGGQG